MRVGCKNSLRFEVMPAHTVEVGCILQHQRLSTVDLICLLIITAEFPRLGQTFRAVRDHQSHLKGGRAF